MLTMTLSDLNVLGSCLCQIGDHRGLAEHAKSAQSSTNDSVRLLSVVTLLFVKANGLRKLRLIIESTFKHLSNANQEF